jgi:CRP-like cAMP-binding protein
MSESPQASDRHLLDHAERLGDGTAFADQIHSFVGRSQFFADLSREDVAELCSHMQVFRAGPRQLLIQEGSVGDYMLLIIEGEVDIFKTSHRGEQQRMTSAQAGRTLGEMSMIDGEPRFATCISVGTVVCGVLSREDMLRIVAEKPALGAKVLIKLVTMLSQRLRHTSAQLMQYLK